MIEWNEYLDKLDKDKRNILLTILKMAKKYSNNAVECMTYGVPGYKLNSKPLIAVAAHKEHYGIYPFSPQVIKASQSLIGDHETSMGTIRFKYGTLPPEKLIERLIELRLKEIK